MAVGKPYPQPAATEVFVPIRMSQASRINAQVFDLQGRGLHTVADQVLAPGEHLVTWPLPTTLANGHYVLRLVNGNTLVTLTHGNKVVEFGQRGEVVWQVNNSHVGGKFADPCGSQRLANGNTVVGSHAANKGISMIEITPDHKIVWTSDHPLAAGVHHFQILTTNGKPAPGMPLK